MIYFFSSRDFSSSFDFMDNWRKH